MKKFVIITDSCSDLEKDLREKYDIIYVPNTYSYDGKTFDANLDFEGASVKEYYDIMRNGTRIITSQVNATHFRKAFEKAILEGYDILSLSASSALSSSIKASYVVRDELLEKYPDAKIICIDTLRSCSGQGLLCIRASELRSEGKTIEEVSEWIEKNKLTMHQEATTNKLIYLKQAGRISATSAFFGGLLNIKPLIISDIHGKNVAVEKVKGRRASFVRIAERIKERIIDVPYQKIFIGHADCLEDALEMKEILENTIELSNIDVHITYIGQIIGASVGPGMIGVYYYGVEETFDSEAK